MVFEDLAGLGFCTFDSTIFTTTFKRYSQGRWMFVLEHVDVNVYSKEKSPRLFQRVHVSKPPERLSISCPEYGLGDQAQFDRQNLALLTCHLVCHDSILHLQEIAMRHSWLSYFLRLDRVKGVLLQCLCAISDQVRSRMSLASPVFLQNSSMSIKIFVQSLLLIHAFWCQFSMRASIAVRLLYHFNCYSLSYSQSAGHPSRDATFVCPDGSSLCLYLAGAGCVNLTAGDTCCVDGSGIVILPACSTQTC